MAPAPGCSSPLPPCLAFCRDQELLVSQGLSGPCQRGCRHPRPGVPLVHCDDAGEAAGPMEGDALDPRAGEKKALSFLRNVYVFSLWAEVLESLWSWPFL